MISFAIFLSRQDTRISIVYFIVLLFFAQKEQFSKWQGAFKSLFSLSTCRHIHRVVLAAWAQLERFIDQRVYRSKTPVLSLSARRHEAYRTAVAERGARSVFFYLSIIYVWVALLGRIAGGCMEVGGTRHLTWPSIDQSAVAKCIEFKMQARLTTRRHADQRAASACNATHTTADDEIWYAAADAEAGSMQRTAKKSCWMVRQSLKPASTWQRRSAQN